jgi:CelD/BcsL family acetyltransferase involved in cellulose biosynthesis
MTLRDQRPATAGEVPVESSAPLSFDLVEGEAAFDNLEHEWNELVDKSDCTVYQTFEWQRTWWKYFGSGKRLHILVLRRGARLAGVAPMFIEDIRAFGVRIVTALKMIGCEESDYLDVISSPDNRTEVLRTLARYISSPDGKWDFFEIRDISERFATMELLPGYLAGEGLRVYTYKGNVCPQVDLPPTWQEFLGHIGGNLRYQLKKKTDRLNKSFPVETEVVQSGDEAVEAAVREFAVIHGNRWESLGYMNAFKDPHFLAFHVEVSQNFARRGWLRMFFLKVDGVRVAVNFDFNFHGRIYFYHGNAHASSEIMKYSPGFLLRCSAIEQGISEGMVIYDMLRGNETYKSNDFKCVPVGNWQIRALRPGLSHRARFGVFVSTELLKKIPKRLRRDYQDFRRFSMTKEPSFSMVLRFAWSKLGEIAKLARYSISRLLPGSKN